MQCARTSFGQPQIASRLEADEILAARKSKFKIGACIGAGRTELAAPAHRSSQLASHIEECQVAALWGPLFGIFFANYCTI